MHILNEGNKIKIKRKNGRKEREGIHIQENNSYCRLPTTYIIKWILMKYRDFKKNQR